MKGIIVWSLVLASILFFAEDLAAAEGPASIIVEVEGAACEKLDQTNAGNATSIRAMLREQALSLARKRSIETAVQYLRQRLPDKAEQSLIPAYTAGKARILYREQGQWSTQEHATDQPALCYSEKVRAEVVPSDATLRTSSNVPSVSKEAEAPLNVSLWTQKGDYAQGESIHLFLEGNKGFYGLLVYKDASGNLVQLLPNPYREDNYFEGGVVYEFPSGGDRFKLEVAPPFGSETLTLYAATAPLGDLQTSQAGSFYQVKTSALDMEIEVRDVHSGAQGDGQDFVPVEFASAPVHIQTHQGK